jgi:hypothetical protein
MAANTANNGQSGQFVPWYISSDNNVDFEAFSDTEVKCRTDKYWNGQCVSDNL